MTAKAVIAFAIPVISRDQAIERKVEATPSKMTLDEKIGRTTEFDIVMIALRGAMTPAGPVKTRLRHRSSINMGYSAPSNGQDRTPALIFRPTALQNDAWTSQQTPQCVTRRIHSLSHKKLTGSDKRGSAMIQNLEYIRQY